MAAIWLAVALSACDGPPGAAPAPAPLGQPTARVAVGTPLSTSPTAPTSSASPSMPGGSSAATAPPLAAQPATPAPEMVAAPPGLPPAELLSAPTAAPGETGTPQAELFAAPAPTPELSVGPATLTSDLAIEQVVERAPLPPEARLLARTLRPTLTAESEDGYWTVAAGPLGRWRVSEGTWDVEPADGVAELWEIQSRLDLR